MAERRAELEDRAEALMRNAPTLAEVLERVERQTKAQDYSTDRERVVVLVRRDSLARTSGSVGSCWRPAMRSRPAT